MRQSTPPPPAQGNGRRWPGTRRRRRRRPGLPVPGRAGVEGRGAAALELSADGGSDVRALEVRLGDELLPLIGQRRWGSTQLRTALLPKDRRRPHQPNEMDSEEVAVIWAEAIARPTLGPRSLLRHLRAGVLTARTRA